MYRLMHSFAHSGLNGLSLTNKIARNFDLKNAISIFRTVLTRGRWCCQKHSRDVDEVKVIADSILPKHRFTVVYRPLERKMLIKASFELGFCSYINESVFEASLLIYVI